MLKIGRYVASAVPSLARFALSAFAAASLGGAALAAPIVDQSTLLFLPDGTRPLASAVARFQPSGIERVQAQTVTAGASGLLTQVDLQIFREPGSGPLVLSIYEGSRAEPGARLVGELPIAADLLPLASEFPNDPFVTIDTGSLMFEVEAGDVFSLQLGPGEEDGSSFARSFWLWGYQSFEFNEQGDPIIFVTIDYDRGTNYISDNGGPFVASAFDRGFRTFVEPIDVPEPATLTLLGLGVLVLGARRRGRSRF